MEEFNKQIELSQAQEISKIAFQQIVKHLNNDNEELCYRWGIILKEATEIMQKK